VPVIRLYVDDKLYNEIKRLVNTGAFPDEATVYRIAIELLLRIIEKARKEGRDPAQVLYNLIAKLL